MPRLQWRVWDVCSVDRLEEYEDMTYMIRRPREGARYYSYIIYMKKARSYKQMKALYPRAFHMCHLSSCIRYIAAMKIFTNRLGAFQDAFDEIHTQDPHFTSY